MSSVSNNNEFTRSASASQRMERKRKTVPAGQVEETAVRALKVAKPYSPPATAAAETYSDLLSEISQRLNTLKAGKVGYEEKVNYILHALVEMILTDGDQFNKGGLYAALDLLQSRPIVSILCDEHREQLRRVISGLIEGSFPDHGSLSVAPVMRSVVKVDLQLESEEQVTPLHAKRAALRALFFDLRQMDNDCNCHAVATLIYLIQTDPVWVYSQYIEMLSKGTFPFDEETEIPIFPLVKEEMEAKGGKSGPCNTLQQLMVSRIEFLGMNRKRDPSMGVAGQTEFPNYPKSSFVTSVFRCVGEGLKSNSPRLCKDSRFSTFLKELEQHLNSALWLKKRYIQLDWDTAPKYYFQFFYLPFSQYLTVECLKDFYTPFCSVVDKLSEELPVTDEYRCGVESIKSTISSESFTTAWADYFGKIFASEELDESRREAMKKNVRERGLLFFASSGGTAGISLSALRRPYSFQQSRSSNPTRFVQSLATKLLAYETTSSVALSHPDLVFLIQDEAHIATFSPALSSHCWRDCNRFVDQCLMSPGRALLRETMDDEKKEIFFLNLLRLGLMTQEQIGDLKKRKTSTFRNFGQRVFSQILSAKHPLFRWLFREVLLVIPISEFLDGGLRSTLDRIGVGWSVPLQQMMKKKCKGSYFSPFSLALSLNKTLKKLGEKIVDVHTIERIVSEIYHKPQVIDLGDTNYSSMKDGKLAHNRLVLTYDLATEKLGFFERNNLCPTQPSAFQYREFDLIHVPRSW
ncbi:MAG: hypothetical protein KR126chlam2_00975 [Chlamydiae bacterium]|nr:hypothetical protein [Chlamydiota bacterium]